MRDVPFLQQVAIQQPWRQGVGYPLNALDPAWVPGPRDQLCRGDVEWEPGTRWWVCQTCGRVGSIFFIEHKPVAGPAALLVEAINLFVKRRQGEDPKEVLEKLAFVAGAAIRRAAVSPDLAAFVDALPRQ